MNAQQAADEVMYAHWREVGHNHCKDHPGVPAYDYTKPETTGTDAAEARRALTDAALAACALCTVYARLAELTTLHSKMMTNLSNYQLKAAHHINVQQRTIEKLKRRLARHVNGGASFARASKDWVKMNAPEVMMGLDDGTFLVEDLVGLPDEAAPAVDDDGRVLDDSGVIDVDPEPEVSADEWAHRWGGLCRAAGATPANSKAILRNVAGVEFAAQVLPDRRTACETALADWVAAMSEPAEDA